MSPLIVKRESVCRPQTTNKLCYKIIWLGIVYAYRPASSTSPPYNMCSSPSLMSARSWSIARLMKPGNKAAREVMQIAGMGSAIQQKATRVAMKRWTHT